MTPSAPILKQWLTALARLEARGDSEKPTSRNDYLALLKELGYDDSAIDDLDRHVESLFTKAHGYRTVNDFESAIPLLEEALKFAPWRADILELMVKSQLRALEKSYSATLYQKSREGVERWIDSAPDHSTPYRAGQRLTQLRQTHLAEKRRKLLVGGLLLSCVVVGACLMTLPSSNHEPKSTPVVEKKSPPLSADRRVKESPTPAASRTQARPPLETHNRLTVTFDEASRIDGLAFETGESTVEKLVYVEKGIGSLRLKLSNQGQQPILALDGLVEWLDHNGRVFLSKKIVLVHKNTGLFPGETAVAYQRNHDLAPDVRTAHIKITHSVFGSKGNTRAAGVPGCLEVDRDIFSTEDFTLKEEKPIQSGFVQTNVFSIENKGNDQQSLYAYPVYYDGDGVIMPKPSTPTLLNRRTLASTILPILRSGDKRFFYLSTFMSKAERGQVAKVCVKLAHEFK